MLKSLQKQLKRKHRQRCLKADAFIQGWLFKANVMAKCFDDPTVVLISGNENQERYGWHKT